MTLRGGFPSFPAVINPWERVSVNCVARLNQKQCQHDVRLGPTATLHNFGNSALIERWDSLPKRQVSMIRFERTASQDRREHRFASNVKR
jgi:hypothetical protein